MYVVIGDGVEEETVAKKVRFSKLRIINISALIVIEEFLIRRCEHSGYMSGVIYS